MAAYFLETSALVKQYVLEQGTGWVQSLLSPGSGHTCWVSEIVGVELLAAIHRRSQIGTITVVQVQHAEQLFRAEFATRFRSLQVAGRVVRLAMDLVTRQSLRAYDSVQLASAILVNNDYEQRGLPGPVFVCADNQLNRIAVAERLTVDDPNLHP